MDALLVPLADRSITQLSQSMSFLLGQEWPGMTDFSRIADRVIDGRVVFTASHFCRACGCSSLGNESLLEHLHAVALVNLAPEPCAAFGQSDFPGHISSLIPIGIEKEQSRVASCIRIGGCTLSDILKLPALIVGYCHGLGGNEWTR